MSDERARSLLTSTESDPMADSPRVTAIALAAGLSRRLGRNKLLLPLGGETVIRKTAKALLASAASEVVVVTGSDEAMTREALSGLAVRFAHNPRYAEGQSASVIAGVRAAAETADAYLFALGDQPLLTARIVNDMMLLYEASRPSAQIVAPRFEGRRGSPTLFSAALREELLQATGDEGGRRVIKKLETESPGKVVFLDLPDDGIFLDIDTEKDYEAALRKFPEASSA